MEFKLLIHDAIYSPIDWIDVFIMAAIFYQLTLLIRGTRSLRIIIGLGVLFTPIFIAPWMRLTTIDWLLSRILPVGIIALVVILQPELRKALEEFGRGWVFGRHLLGFREEDVRRVVKQIGQAVNSLSKRRVGALIVLERETGLEDFIQTGVRIHSRLVSELIETIFHPNAPLHDGAIIVREDLIQSTSCILPLSENPTFEKTLGTRHRAAVGITEISDALAVVVSEETGSIALMFNGKMTRNLDIETLTRLLYRMYRLNYQRKKTVSVSSIEEKA